jgi:hypothetical protein
MIGDVYSKVTYSVKDSVWKITMEATSPQALTRAYHDLFLQYSPRIRLTFHSRHVNAAYLLQPGCLQGP